MKQIQLLFRLSILIFLVSCSSEKPESVLQSYLDASKNQDFERAYELISQADKEIKSLEEYKSDVAVGNQLFSNLADKINYEVISVEREENQAIAKVEVTAPDLSGMMKEFLGAAFKSALSEEGSMSEKEIEERFEKYEGEDFPTKTTTDNYHLVNEEGEWRVFLNWKKDELIASAKEKEENEKFEEALELFREALATDSSDIELQEKVAELEAQLIAIREQEAYLSKVEVYDVSAGYYDSILDGRIPGLNFKLRNNGDRTLRKVQVTAYFQDKEGKTIFEKDYTPVLVSEYSFDNDKPLKPGYVWRQERGRFYAAKECPEEWKSGAVEVKVTEVAFLEERVSGD